MATLVPEQRRVWWSLREVWASLAISVIWLAVLFGTVFGPDIQTNDGTTIPSGVALAFFAMLASFRLARALSPRD